MSSTILPPAGGRIRRDPTTIGEHKAVICTLATGPHRELLKHTAPTLDAYARLHGWSLVVSSEDLSAGRPASWSKVRLVRELLAEFEFVFWIDADAVIVNAERSVIGEVRPDADIWFARHAQERDVTATVPNAGVFLARSCDFTVDLLDAIWRAEEFIDHNWWENAALIDLLGQSLRAPYEHVRSSAWNLRLGELPLDWNSVPGYCESPNPAINHHARCDHDDFEFRLRNIRRDSAAYLDRS